MKTSQMKTLIMVCITVLIMGSSAYGAAVTARLSGIKGKVDVSKGDTWTAAKDGDNIAGGAKLRTGADGGCLATWGGGNAVKVQPLTIMTLEQLEKDGTKETSRLSISQGNVLARAKKISAGGSLYSVRTPTAVAGVRGTDFAVGMVGDVSFVKVVEGSIEVSVDGAIPVIVESGFEVTVPVGVTAIPAPEPIPPVELNELQQNLQEVKTAVETSAGAAKDEVKKETVAATKESAAPPEGKADVTEAPAVSPPDVSDAMNAVDQTVNAVNTTLQTADVQDAIQQVGQALLITGTVQVDINVGPPQLNTGTVQVDINVTPK